MVIISGQVPSTLVGTDAFQETDMIGISRPIVKHSFMIKHASEIPEVMKKAFYLAQSGRPGPVVVDIPKDMTNPAEKFEYIFPKKAKLRSYSPAGTWPLRPDPQGCRDAPGSQASGALCGRRR